MAKGNIKQLVILSGKGGTGKTSLAAAFAHLACTGTTGVQAVMADADVDAANLELILAPKQEEASDFWGGEIAVIDQDRCQGCGTCETVCRFDAVLSPAHGLPYRIDPIACEGCAACVYQCPEDAITMKSQHSGRWYRSTSRFGPLFHAELFPGQENSGKLVTLIKQHARLWALDQGQTLVIVDGPPGIGCPVIAAAGGADLAVIVSEPSAASIHDLMRAAQTTAHFHIPTVVVINKADIYPPGVREIENVCATIGVDVVGSIPYDQTVTEAMLNAQPVTLSDPISPSSQAFAGVWQSLQARLFKQEISS